MQRRDLRLMVVEEPGTLDRALHIGQKGER